MPYAVAPLPGAAFLSAIRPAACPVAKTYLAGYLARRVAGPFHPPLRAHQNAEAQPPVDAALRLGHQHLADAGHVGMAGGRLARNVPSPWPRWAASTNTSHSQANVARTVTSRAKPAWAPSAAYSPSASE